MIKENLDKLIKTDIFVIPYEGKYIVYAPMRKAAFIANAATVNFVNRLRHTDVTVFSDDERAFLRFLENLSIIGNGKDIQVAQPVNNEFKPTYITFFLTTECNLNCIYCYASTGTHKHASMDMDIARKGIDLVCQNATELEKNEFGIGYHGGGEPTANWHVLTESFRYARDLAKKHGIRFFATAASNGVYSRKRLDWIVANLQGMSLSVDGLPEVHDYQRPRKNGRPSSHSVFKTIRVFEESKFPYSIRATVTAYSVERLPESLQYLLERSSPKRVLAEPVYNLGRGQNREFHIDPARFVSAFREAERIAAGFGVPFFYSGARIDVLTNRFCGACREGFCLTPEGKVSACYEVFDEDVKFSREFIFGHYDTVKDLFVFNHEKLKKLKGRTVEGIEWCSGCFAKWHCAGDCPNLVRHSMVKGEFRGSPRCEITRELLLDQIVSKISESGGLLWRGNSDGVSEE